MRVIAVGFSRSNVLVRFIRTLIRFESLKRATLAAFVSFLCAGWSSGATLVISEVNAAGSSSSYLADWFELTNTDSLPLNISGWKIDDSSAAFGSAVGLRGVTSIAPGQSVVFAEGNATGTTDSTIQTNFISAWFGGAAPAGFTMGFYGGSGVGMSTTAGDGVNIFDSGGASQASVSFGATPTGSPLPTLDNLAGLSGTISTPSSNGVNGAFVSNSGTEVGSPGNLGGANIPEPGSALLLVLGAGVWAVSRARRCRQAG